MEDLANKVAKNTKTSVLRYAYLAHGVFVTIVVLAQLFTIDKIAIEQPFSGIGGRLFLISMMLSAVLSLPYVLKIKTSAIVQRLSFCCALLLPILWSIYGYIAITLQGVGLMGTIIASNAVTFGLIALGLVFTATAVCHRGVPSLKKRS